MATSVRQFENALQVIINLHYLIEVDVSNPSHVLKFVRMTDPSVKTLTTLLSEMRDTYYIDLLFYHAHLHRYVVIDLKVREFEPEYAR